MNKSEEQILAYGKRVVDLINDHIPNYRAELCEDNSNSCKRYPSTWVYVSADCSSEGDKELYIDILLFEFQYSKKPILRRLAYSTRRFEYNIDVRTLYTRIKEFKALFVEIAKSKGLVKCLKNTDTQPADK